MPHDYMLTDQDRHTVVHQCKRCNVYWARTVAGTAIWSSEVTGYSTTEPLCVTNESETES